MPGTQHSIVPGFASGLEDFAARTALICDDGREISYADLAIAADGFAARLAPDARLILIEGCNETQAIAAFLGVLRSGRTALLHPPGPETASSRIARVFQPDAIYCRVGGEWVLKQTGDATACHPDLGLLLSTSGTTGAAKLVRLSRTALDANARSIAEYLALDADERPLAFLPIHYSFGLSILNSHLLVGATLLLTNRSVVDQEFWRFAAEHKATSLAGVPHTYEMLERGRLLDHAPNTLRTLTQAGGRLPPQAVDYPRKQMEKRGGRMFIMYGQTEATARIAYLPPRLLADHPDCIGVAIPGGALSIRNEAGETITRAGEPGELIYTGPNVMMGYALGREDLARGQDLAELATGDIAERTPEGLFRIVGRRSRFVKPFGLRVALDEIERALEAEGRSVMAAGSDDLIAIGIKADAASEADATSITAALAERYKLPAQLFHVVRLEDWPLLPTGKRDYAALLSRAEAERRASGSGKQVSVQSIFAARFPGAAVNPDSSFTSLGGDSLNYVETSIALEDALGHLPRGWENLSAQQLDLLRLQFNGSRAKGAFKKLDSDIVLRCVAISAVVAHHASPTDDFAGGVTALLVLVGYSWARFQRAQLIAGRPWSMLERLGLAILLPYYAMLALLLASGRPVPESAWSLTANYDPALRGFVQPFWFVSAYAQATALVAIAAIAVPAFRRAIDRKPLQAGLAGIALAFTAMLCLQPAGLSFPSRSVDEIFPLLAFGWCLAFASSVRRQWAVCAAALLVTIADMIGDRSAATASWTFAAPYWVLQTLWLSLTMGLILWAPRLSLPRWAVGPCAAIASASLTIFLTHTAFLWGIGRVVHSDSPGLAAACVVIALGTAIHQGVVGLSRFIGASLRKRREELFAKGAA